MCITMGQIKANASVRNSKTRKKIEKDIEKLNKEIKTILMEAKEVDEKEDALYGDKNPYTGEGKVSPLLKKLEKVKKLEDLREILLEKEKEKKEKEKKEKINTTDPDANIMQFSDKKNLPPTG